MWTDPPVPPAARMLQLMEMSDSLCHYPYGDPRKSDFGYCGCRIEEDVPAGLRYCKGHLAIIYRPIERRA